MSIPPTIVALLVVGLLALVMRWVFRPARPNSRPRRPVDAADAEDLGLLTVVLSGLSRAEALDRRTLLRASGIRASVSARRDGRLDLLVFHADADKARMLLGP